MENGAKVLTFIQLRKSSILYVWLWMVRGAATEKSGCAEWPADKKMLYFKELRCVLLVFDILSSETISIRL